MNISADNDTITVEMTELEKSIITNCLTYLCYTKRPHGLTTIAGAKEGEVEGILEALTTAAPEAAPEA
jgi:hypothetical protein